MIWLLLLLFAREASAHDLQPGVLSLAETERGRFDVVWSEPIDASGASDGIRIVYPPGCTQHDKRLTCEGELAGAIGFEGLRSSRTKIMVTVKRRDGRTEDGIATSNAPRVELGRGESGFTRWAQLGMEHVFTGFDHVAFVVGLFLVVGARRRLLLATVTAFTIAHSSTLALASLHVVSLPRAPVEATIAASVLLVAREALRDRETLTRTRPWLVAFVFGLVHGLGFAGALGELPLPKTSFVLALVSFNVGVELAQLVILGLLVLAAFVLQKRQAVATRVAAYAIGILGAWWFIDRAYLVLKR